MVHGPLSRRLLAALLPLLFSSAALAIGRYDARDGDECRAQVEANFQAIVNGKPVFQDQPCDDQRETVGQGFGRQKRIEAYHRELDQLAAQGVGFHRQAPIAVEPPRKPADDDGNFHPKSRRSRLRSSG